MTVVIKVDVDELRPVGKLVISIQLFKVEHWFTSINLKGDAPETDTSRNNCMTSVATSACDKG